MSHVKAGGTSKTSTTMPVNVLALSALVAKQYRNGEVLVRQTGSTKIAGPGTYISKNFTIHAAQDGIVSLPER